MSWLKTVWNFLRKKDLVKQTTVSQGAIDNFAKLLADRIHFDKVMNGKIAFLDNYDYWAIRQIVIFFIVLFQNKFKPSFWVSFEQFLIYFADKNPVQAGHILSYEINKELKALALKEAQDLFVQRQISLIFELSMIYLEQGDVELA